MIFWGSFWEGVEGRCNRVKVSGGGRVDGRRREEGRETGGVGGLRLG